MMIGVSLVSLLGDTTPLLAPLPRPELVPLLLDTAASIPREYDNDPSHTPIPLPPTELSPAADERMSGVAGSEMTVDRPIGDGISLNE